MATPIMKGTTGDAISPRKSEIKLKKSKKSKTSSTTQKTEETIKAEDANPNSNDAPVVLDSPQPPLQDVSAGLSSNLDGNPTVPQKKSKKRKHAAVDLDAHRPNPDEVIPPQEPPPKKHKNRTEFADPRVDSTLNSQSRKALEYAFLQMNRPSKWKFNKARQNWLIRNVWNPEAVSDAYFPFVLKYLANVQGGSRQKLKETCETHLKPIEMIKPLEGTSLEENIQAVDAPKSILKTNKSPEVPMAGPLITSPTPGALITLDPSVPLQKSVLPPAPDKLDIAKRQRAQSLLDALGPDT